MHDRLWFDLGWDYAAQNVRVPEDAPPDLLVGYKEGKSRFRKPVSDADRYVRKWLQLRNSALRRQRHFDPNVTAEFLRYIDTGICPVTEAVLTHGTLTDTDWSVDRVVNDGAYCCSNLVIMSTRANAAKSSLSFLGVYDQVLLGESCNKMLSPLEWYRLISLMFPSHYVTGNISEDEEWYIPLNPYYPEHLPNTFDNQLQLFFATFATDRASQGALLPLDVRLRFQKFYSHVKASSSRNGLEILKKMMIKMERKANSVANPGLLLWNPSIFRLYKAWLETGPDIESLIGLSKRFLTVTDQVKADQANAMHMNTRGFMMQE